MFHASMKAEMDALEARKAELAGLLDATAQDTPVPLPSVSLLHTWIVAQLAEALILPLELQRRFVARPRRWHKD